MENASPAPAPVTVVLGWKRSEYAKHAGSCTCGKKILRGLPVAERLVALADGSCKWEIRCSSCRNEVAPVHVIRFAA